MMVELVYDRECPNVAETRANLLRAFADANIPAKWKEWERSSADTPAFVRPFDSPTVLVEGRDIAGSLPAGSQSACRLYSHENGKYGEVPSVKLIREALLREAPPNKSFPPRARRGHLAVLPGIGVSLLPKLACPACWPAYSGVLSSLGLGFLISTTYLLPVTALFLLIAVGALAFRARARRGYGPALLGMLAAATVLFGKFGLESSVATYGGLAVLVFSSVWNSWPVKATNSCPRCAPVDSEVTT